jgi:hypothetical protein
MVGELSQGGNLKDLGKWVWERVQGLATLAPLSQKIVCNTLGRYG